MSRMHGEAKCNQLVSFDEAKSHKNSNFDLIFSLINLSTTLILSSSRQCLSPKLLRPLPFH
jgi:hypothetical protein